MTQESLLTTGNTLYYKGTGAISQMLTQTTGSLSLYEDRIVFHPALLQPAWRSMTDDLVLPLSQVASARRSNGRLLGVFNSGRWLTVTMRDGSEYRFLVGCAWNNQCETWAREIQGRIQSYPRQ
jgi:hypothetical protein